MSSLEEPSKVEEIVGVRRHSYAHIARAVSSEEKVYILHSEMCVNTSIDLRDCWFSLSLDRGLIEADWEGWIDHPTIVVVEDGYITPLATSTDRKTYVPREED